MSQDSDIIAATISSCSDTYAGEYSAGGAAGGADDGSAGGAKGTGCTRDDAAACGGDGGVTARAGFGTARGPVHAER